MDKGVIAIIPARMKSSRFPGKPLAEIDGVPMVVRVAKNVSSVFGVDNTFVATDSDLIASTCKENGINTVVVTARCENGTERCILAMKQLDLPQSAILFNIQGDEPGLDPQSIDSFRRQVLSRPNVKAANGFYLESEKTASRGANSVSLVTDRQNQLLYASRCALPSQIKSKDPSLYRRKYQVGIYAFSNQARESFMESKGDLGPLESSEDIEILRLVENQLEVQMVPLAGEFTPVDTPEDLELYCRKIP